MITAIAGLEIIVEAGFSTPSMGDFLILNDVARGKLNTGTLGPDNVWADITQWVQAFSIRRDANQIESPVVRYEAGTATVELNNSDRRFDPTNLAGPYVAAGVTQVTPMRPIRIRAIWNWVGAVQLPPIDFDLFRGFADKWDVTYAFPNYSRCTLTATDGMKVFASIDRLAGSAVGGGENAGARVNRILNSASWPAADRMVSAGDTLLQSTTLDGNVLAELLLAQDTEIGELYVDGAGRVVFRNRHAVMEDLRSISSNVLFSDQPS